MIISFIVIGKNEGWKLKNCLKSIMISTSINNLQNFEIIYVDSQSNDDSIEIANSFSNVKIFQIDGYSNPAIARNIGAKESKGDYIWFVDGDMELQPYFYKEAFDTNGKLVYPFISGGLVNYNYDYNWKLLNKTDYHRNSPNDKYEQTTGGIFIVDKNLWYKSKGMNTKFKVNEDLDFGLRLMKLGFPILRKKEIIALHHTIPYNNVIRYKKMIFSGIEMYPSILFRNHINNKYVVSNYISSNYTVLFLILSFCLVFINNVLFLFSTIFYVILILFKSYRKKNIYGNNLFINSYYHFIRDCFRLLGLIFYFPKNNENIKYTQIL